MTTIHENQTASAVETTNAETTVVQSTTPSTESTVTPNATTEKTSAPATTSAAARKKERNLRDYVDIDPLLDTPITADMIATGVFKQRWMLVIFASHKNVVNSTMDAMKVRGVYETHEEACAEAARFRKLDDNRFNVWVGQVGHWTEFDPNPDDVKDQRHVDDRLNDLLKGQNDNFEKSRKVHEERVLENQRRAQMGPRMSEITERLQNKLAAKKENQTKMENTNKLVSGTTETVSQSENVPSSTAARRLKKQLQKTTAEGLAQAEHELEQRQQKIRMMREELGRREAKTSQLSGEATKLSKDVEDIRSMYLQQREH